MNAARDARPNLLEVRGLSIGLRDRDRRPLPILRDVDLTLRPGEIIGIVGESGSGKSTLALAVMGYVRPGLEILGGEVRFDDHDILSLAAPALAAIRGGELALIPQNAAQSLTPTMTIGNQLAEALQLHSDLPRRHRRKRVLDLLGEVQLADPDAIARRFPHQLSGGQQQRCAISIALAAGPKLLILDEPTTALDAATQAGILNLLHTLSRSASVAMIYVSHSLAVVGNNCERLAVMYGGEIVEEGETGRLLFAPAHPYTSGLLSSLPSLRRPGIPPAMPGAPPRLDLELAGCRFAPRCSHAVPRCADRPPATPSMTGGRVRCFQPLTAPLEIRPTRDRNTVSDDLLLRVGGMSYAYPRSGLLERVVSHAPTTRPALQDIGFELRVGETLGVVGESGSGKSTLLHLLLGMRTPYQGTALLAPNHDLTAPLARRSLALLRDIQMVFQNPGGTLNPRHTVEEILARPLRLYAGELALGAVQRRAIELLEQVRLGIHHLGRYPAQLSGGERQRVAIARAFAAQPRLILCDEVTSALDVSVQAAVLRVLSDLQREQRTACVFVSHDLAVVRAVADQVVVLLGGRICEAGPVERVFAPPFHPYTEALLDHVRDPGDIVPSMVAQPAAQSTVAAENKPTAGCAYHRHCPHSLGARCADVRPEARQLGAGHVIFCHLPFAQALETSAAATTPSTPRRRMTLVPPVTPAKSSLTPYEVAHDFRT